MTRTYVAAVSVQDLVVVLNLKDEMVDHALGHGDLSINEEAERAGAVVRSDDWEEAPTHMK